MLTVWVRTAAVALTVASPLVVIPWGLEAYALPKALVLYGMTVLIALAWAVSYLLAARPRWRMTTPELALWGFLLALLISSWVSVDTRMTFLGVPHRYDGLLTYVSYVVLYFAGAHFFGSESGVRRIVLAAAGAALVAITYGVIQPFLSPLFEGEAVVRSDYSALGYPRSASTLGSPIVFGGYLSLLIPLLLGLALSDSGPRWVVWLVGAGLGFVATVLTVTRAAWLAVAIGTGILMVAQRGARSRDRIVFAVAVSAPIVGILLLMTAVATPGQLGDRVSESFAAQSGSLGNHVYIWQHTLGLIRSRPLLGWGLETLQQVFPYDRPSLVKQFGPAPVIIDRAHNDVLQMAVSIGIPGALIYVVFWVLVVLTAIRIWRRASGAARPLVAGWLAAVVAYLVQAQFSFSPVLVAPVVWLLAGAVAGWEAAGRGQ